jgi:histidyl-tRNA synthetase
MDEEGIAAPAAPTVDVFFVLEDDAPRRLVAGWVADLRRAGIATETDHAGRSLKGQLTQAGRLGASRTVVVGPETATLRTPGGVDEPLALHEVVARLSS